MTTAEALAIAAQAKPIRREPLDKLQGNSMAAAADALAKRYDAIGGTLAKAQGQLNQLAADVEYVRDYQPGQTLRRMHS
jgi:ABC-type transporter Mla subunit MlaD